MKIQYEQYYVGRLDITIIMKAIINEKGEQIKYELSGYYFGEPSIYDLEQFKDNLGGKKQ